jgi:hypothetical protein
MACKKNEREDKTNEDFSLVGSREGGMSFVFCLTIFISIHIRNGRVKLPYTCDKEG